jgi:membrane-bound serine protease (ClpP class)
MKPTRSPVARRIPASFGAVLAVCLLAGIAGGAPAAAAPRVNLATISGTINPASADYIVQAVARSEAEGVDALLIEMDTEGGLVSATKEIIQAILNSEVPVIVYVAPRGAWAASAGTYITVAGHVAAMAPGSSIGAAHPVGAGGGDQMPAAPRPEDEGQEGGAGKDADGKGPAAPAMRNLSMEKAENLLAAYAETLARERDRNVEWVVDAVRNSVAIGEQEALELNVIDLVAEDRYALFEALEGREVKVAGKTVVLSLTGARVTPVEMTLVQKVFDFVAHPNVALVLLLLGGLGLYIEANNPGLLFPGLSGLVCLLLAGIGFNLMPFSWVGLVLILLGLALFVAELFFTSFGALFAAGALCILLGGTMVFDQPELSDLTVSFWSVLLPTVLGMCIFGGLVVFSVGRSMMLKPASGVDEIIGLVGRSASDLDPKGKVFVRGEYWNVEAEGGETISEGEPVEVVAVEGLTLRVRRAQSK